MTSSPDTDQTNRSLSEFALASRTLAICSSDGRLAPVGNDAMVLNPLITMSNVVVERCIMVQHIFSASHG